MEVDTNSLPQGRLSTVVELINGGGATLLSGQSVIWYGSYNQRPRYSRWHELLRVECNSLYLVSISFQNRSQDRSRHIVLKSSANSEAFHAKIPRCAPLGGLVVWRRSGLVDMSEKRGQLGGLQRMVWIVLGEEVDDMCGGIVQQVSCSDVESCSVGVLICVEGIMERVAGRVRKWFLGEEFGGLWVMLPHLAIRNGAFAGAYTHLFQFL
ncbi:hypothetical protein C8J57DRAFT_1240654 [Mycena rebaudengoi]|nr:hypothetical protein C8J57DRAFT_1240654 [Mycena rebaudengoi]